MLYLVLVHERLDEVRIPIANEMRIGRSPTNTLVINDESASTHHAKITKQGNSFRLIDLDSTNGTKINEKLVSDTLLREGDLISFGSVRYRLVSKKIQFRSLKILLAAACVIITAFIAAFIIHKEAPVRQLERGRAYQNGKEVKVDLVEAVKWFRKAAERGNAEAQNQLGICNFHGKGVAINRDEAAKWFRKAADQGNAEAQFYLGLCYLRGNGVTQDLEEAVRWFRKSADQGNAEAQNQLGICYRMGAGVSRDKEEAVKWFRKAAEQGYAQAQRNLGGCYDNGKGVVQDKEEAMKWYRKAEEQVNYHAGSDKFWGSAGELAASEADKEGYRKILNSHPSGSVVPPEYLKVESGGDYYFTVRLHGKMINVLFSKGNSNPAAMPFDESNYGWGEKHVWKTHFRFVYLYARHNVYKIDLLDWPTGLKFLEELNEKSGLKELIELDAQNKL